jgi:hypothetical protein
LLIISFLILAWATCVLCLIRNIWLLSKPERGQYFNGPRPTSRQRADNLQFINEFLEEHPDSGLAKEYPYCAEVAKATKAYKDLERRRPFMDAIDYEIALDRISRSINLSDIQ